MMEGQTFARKVQLFKRSLELQTVAAGVFIQKIPGSYLKRLVQSEADATDPLVKALKSLDKIFDNCKQKLVDMSSSLEAIVDEQETGSGSAGILLAWSLQFDAAEKKMKEPELVGMATLFDFLSSENFSTLPSQMKEADFAKLKPFFGNTYVYIDSMCSKRQGVGRLLVLHTYKYALSRKRVGVIALSYSSKKGATPESKRIFQQLNFNTLIPEASYTIQKMHGTWFYKTTSEVDLAGITQSVVAICTRKGFTEKTADNTIWRCPN